jgi:tetratricopeptide (TPR) repeat protein
MWPVRYNPGGPEIPMGKFRQALILSFALYLSVVFNPLSAQQDAPKKSLILVTSFGPGAIHLPTGPDWKADLLTVYDDGRRPVAQLHKGETITASFVLFENLSGKPSSKGCRQDVIEPIIAKDAGLISKRAEAEEKNAAGETLATTTYLLDLSAVAKGHHQRNLFAFAGDARTCAEIHISSVDESQDEAERMKALIAAFQPDLSYQPTATDYFRLGQVFFKNTPALAGPYFKASLGAMPNDPTYLTARRIATDQLVMSLGMSGDLKGSRAAAENAIATDPDYPRNYYNLACADAEQGKASDARLHLQQAFDRRANVLKGESMPDPTQDDSILKLKKDQAFWAFVLTLPKK